MDSITKKCTECGLTKNIGDFYISKGKPLPACKECEKESARQWKRNNKEKHLSSVKDWKRNNKEKVLSQPWRTSEKQRAKHRAERRAFREKYPEKIRAQKQKRRALKMGATGSFTDKEWLELKKKFNNLCAKCGEAKPLTVDHVVPLIAGGSNSIDNIQPLCLSCNASKGKKTIDYRK